MSEEQTVEDGAPPPGRRRLSFTPDIRLGDVLATVGMVTAAIFAWSNMQAELRVVKEAQAAQMVTNREIRQEVRDVAVEIRQDIRDLRRELRPRTAM